jgi:hypothetical protein
MRGIGSRRQRAPAVNETLYSTDMTAPLPINSALPVVDEVVIIRLVTIESPRSCRTIASGAASCPGEGDSLV